MVNKPQTKMQNMKNVSSTLKNWKHEAQDKMEDKVGEIKDKVEDIKGKAAEKIEAGRAKGKLYVAQNPEKSILTAVGVGLVVGVLISSLFHGRCHCRR